MKKLIVASLFGSLVSFSAMAGEAGPQVLTSDEMDKVTAAGVNNWQSNYAYVEQNAEAEAEAGDIELELEDVEDSVVLAGAFASASNSSVIWQSNQFNENEFED